MFGERRRLSPPARLPMRDDDPCATSRAWRFLSFLLVCVEMLLLFKIRGFGSISGGSRPRVERSILWSAPCATPPRCRGGSSSPPCPRLAGCTAALDHRYFHRHLLVTRKGRGDVGDHPRRIHHHHLCSRRREAVFGTHRDRAQIGGIGGLNVGTCRPASESSEAAATVRKASRLKGALHPAPAILRPYEVAFFDQRSWRPLDKRRSALPGTNAKMDALPSPSSFSLGDASILMR